MKYKFVFIDVDGVLRDFVLKLRELFKRDFPDEKILREDIYDLRSWSTIGDRIFPWVTDGSSAKELFIESYPFKTSVKRLKDWIDTDQQQVEFAIVTRQVGDRIEWTKEWLEKYGIDGKIPVHYSIDKVKTMTEAMADSLGSAEDIPFDKAVLLDDSPAELYNAAKAGIKTVCVNRTWNSEWKGKKIDDLSEFDPFEK